MRRTHTALTICVLSLALHLTDQQPLYNSSEMGVSAVSALPLLLNATTTRSTAVPVRAAEAPLNCVQKLSCRNRCHNDSDDWDDLSDDVEHCHCDQACLKYRDCCADFTHYCEPSPVNQGMSMGSGYSCVDISTDGDKGVVMISNCTANWGEDDVRHKCVEASTNSNRSFTSENIEENIPVSSLEHSGTHYRNVYCDICNNNTRFVSVFWKLKFRCNIQAPSHYNTKQKLNFYLKYCPKTYMEPEKPFKMRTCLPMLSTCSVDNEHKEKCVEGNTGLVYSYKTRLNYKNIHCLRCNGESSNSSKCGPQESGKLFKPKSFEIIMSFNPQIDANTAIPHVRSLSTACDANKKYDPHLETCEKDSVLDPSFAVRDTYRVKIWMYPSDDIESPVLPEDFTSAICTRFALEPSQIDVISIRSEDGSSAVDFNLYSGAGQTAKGSEDNDTLAVSALLNFNDSFPIVIANKTWLVLRVTQRQLSCANPEEFTHGQFQLLPSGEALIPDRTGGNVSERLPRNMFFEKHNDNGNNSLIVCRSEFSVSCPFRLLLISSSEYKIAANNSLLHTTTGRVYAAGEYDLINELKKAWICTNFTGIRLLDHETVKTSENTFLLYFTIAGFSLSMLALALTLTVHCIFSELRGPLPGKNLMSLCLALLLAQFMWLFGSGDTDKPTFCTVMAAVIHFLILASFGCSAVIAFDTRRTFSSQSKAPSRSPGQSRNLRFLAYTCLAWGVPLLFVAGCVLLDHFQVVYIGYGNENACWIVSSDGKIVTFATPIACVLLYNVGAFTHTVWAINSARKQTHRVKSSRQDQKAVFKIYVRLVSLMGFTWFFSFSAELIHKALVYPFVVLTTTQGVYIFVAFICKARVLKIIKERFPRSRKDAMASTQHTASTECRSLPPNSPYRSDRDTRM